MIGRAIFLSRGDMQGAGNNRDQQGQCSVRPGFDQVSTDVLRKREQSHAATLQDLLAGNLNHSITARP